MNRIEVDHVERQRNDSRLVKIHFPLDEGLWHGHTTESLWAEKIGRGQYRLLNSPFLVFGVNFNDVVSARSTSDGLVFQSVIKRGGHSTYRIIFQDSQAPASIQLSAKLKQLGCSVEWGSDSFAAVDVPPSVDPREVYSTLAAGDTHHLWDFEEGHFAGKSAPRGSSTGA